MCSAEQILALPVNVNDKKRYFDCQNCYLVFLDRAQCLTAADEKTRYLKHNNDIYDANYQKFVSDITSFVTEHIAVSSLGLDFGAGTGPVLSKVLEEKNYMINLYDPFFHPNEDNLKLSYDFIMSCEVVEHFNHPLKEFNLLRSLLKVKSHLIIKTEILTPKINFDSWYYRKDPTHISFYRMETFEWIKKNYQFNTLENLNGRTIVLSLY